jgi:hypothetical protein
VIRGKELGRGLNVGLDEKLCLLCRAACVSGLYTLKGSSIG